MSFEQQISYNNWANNLILEAVGDSSETKNGPDILKQLGHLIHVQIEWHNRVMKIKKHTSIWPVLSFEECENLILNPPVDLNNLIPQVEEVCSYKKLGRYFVQNKSL